MYKTYTLKLSAPEITQVKMCTKDCFMQFFSDIYEYPEHMAVIEDEAPQEDDTVKMVTVKKDGHAYSIFKVWGDAADMAIFEADLEERCRCNQSFTPEIKECPSPQEL